ncbi:hypothetical protein CBR_g2826 [Chara braunii]|uniref:Reverse transcriptase RNase H-like domain-containing protein n=1 Tax=Chara braunii TaxID=69332 RepID=A0A388KDZ2_CHABU|nr:hypothetical protein CBR_g2826 [Chara braunii]|eukprot:GBG68278.1 hypothetical protein CBR_g2826 [Chara braunii]
MKGHVIRFCQILAKDEKDHIVFTTIRGEVFDFEGNLIDQDIEGRRRKKAFRRMGRPLLATFRLASPEEASLFEFEETMASLEIGGCDEKKLKERKKNIAHRAREVTRKLDKCRDSIVQLCVDMDRVWPNLPNVFLFGGWGNEGQDGSAPAAASAPEATPMTRVMTMSRPVLKRGMPTVLVQTRKGRKTSQSQPAPGESSRGPQEKEPIQIEEGDDNEEDERLRAEDELLAKQRAMERASEAGKTQVEEEEPRKKKKNVYSIPVEQGIDFEQLVDRILESQRDLVTMKEILAVSPKFREEFKQCMTRKKVMTVKLSLIKVQIGREEFSARIDDGAKMNIMRERHAIEAGIQINRNDFGYLIEVSGATPFCGTASGVIVTVGKVKARSYFCILPKVEHEVLLGRSFQCRTESIIFNKHDDTMFVALCDPVCGYYEVVKCANTGPANSRNRLNPESYTFLESEKSRKEKEAIDEEKDPQEFSLTLPSISQTVDFAASHPTIDPSLVQALMKAVVDKEGEGTMHLVYRPNESRRPFIIETDAGPTALGGVLVQKDGEGRERPLRFESRTLNITERNYSQFKKETLAVLHCLRIFRNYVFGRRFILRVDPTALAQSLKNYSPSDSTMARWLTYIWMFNFEIERILGTQNRADGLSRVDWDSLTDQAEDLVPVDGFLEGEESQLSINSYNYLADATTRNGKTIWNASCFHHVRSDLVIGEPFIEEDPWGERTSEQMMNLALSDEVEEPLTIEYGHEQADKTFRITGEMSFLVNSLIHEDRLKMMNEEAEGSEIREAFREGEYDGVYKL